MKSLMLKFIVIAVITAVNSFAATIYQDNFNGWAWGFVDKGTNAYPLTKQVTNSTWDAYVPGNNGFNDNSLAGITYLGNGNPGYAGAKIENGGVGTTFFTDTTQAITTNTLYTLSVDVNVQNWAGGGKGWNAELLLFTGSYASPTLLGTGALSGTIADAGGESGWQTATASFSSGNSPTGNVWIGLRRGAASQTEYTYMWFDNVVLDATAVPEPAALTLLGLGGLVLLRRRRR